MKSLNFFFPVKADMLHFTTTEFAFASVWFPALYLALNAGKIVKMVFWDFQPKIPAFKAGLGRTEK